MGCKTAFITCIFLSTYSAGWASTCLHDELAGILVQTVNSPRLGGKPVFPNNAEKFLPDPHIHLLDLKSSPENPFIIGGVNRHETIQEMKTLTGVDIDVLNKKARPRSWNSDPFDSKGRSHTGWIKKGESLRDVLRTDNILVLDELGMTHQQVAEPLLLAMKKYEEHARSLHSSKVVGEKRKMFWVNAEQDVTEITGDTFIKFTFNGIDYEFVGGAYLGGGNILRGPGGKMPPAQSGWTGDFSLQSSLFDDKIAANYEFTIKNLKTGEILVGNAITPHLGYRYGFWQSGPYRMDPKKTAEFFKLRPAIPKSNRVLEKKQKTLPNPR